MVNNSDEFLASVSNGYVVVLPLASFLSKIFGKRIVPITDKLCSVEQSVT